MLCLANFKGHYLLPVPFRFKNIAPVPPLPAAMSNSKVLLNSIIFFIFISKFIVHN